jgi:hypothetical protein
VRLNGSVGVSHNIIHYDVMLQHSICYTYKETEVYSYNRVLYILLKYFWFLGVCTGWFLYI